MIKKIKNREKRTTDERKVQMTVEEKFQIQAFMKKDLMNAKDEVRKEARWVIDEGNQKRKNNSGECMKIHDGHLW